MGGGRVRPRAWYVRCTLYGASRAKLPPPSPRPAPSAPSPSPDPAAPAAAPTPLWMKYVCPFAKSRGGSTPCNEDNGRAHRLRGPAFLLRAQQGTLAGQTLRGERGAVRGEPV